MASFRGSSNRIYRPTTSTNRKTLQDESRKSILNPDNPFYFPAFCNFSTAFTKTTQYRNIIIS